MSTNKSIDEPLIKQLISLIEKGNAHVSFEKSVDDLAFKNTGIKPANLPYSISKLVEHIRIVQWDILEFSRNPYHISPEWPKEYWPAEDAPADEQSWQKSLRQIRQNRTDFIALLNKPGVDLYTPFLHGDGQNLLREALLIADHNSYHTGQIILIRRLLNDWKE